MNQPRQALVYDRYVRQFGNQADQVSLQVGAGVAPGFMSYPNRRD